MLYIFLSKEELVTGKEKLGSDPIPIVNLIDSSRIVYPNNSSLVNYTDNGDRI